MPLSLTPTARGKLKNFLICLSLGNLFFLRRWYDLEHLQTRAMDYYRSAPADQTFLFATVFSGLLLGLCFWLAWLAVERSNNPMLKTLARIGFLAALVFPLESVRRYWNLQTGHADPAANGALLAGELMLAAGVVMMFRGNFRILHAARRVTLMMSILLPLLLLDFALGRAESPGKEAFQPKHNTPMLPARANGPGHRLIWILFDEFDQRLAFERRPASLQLPELDRLRAESVVSNQVTQTASWTILAVPSLISGRILSRAEMVNADTLSVHPEGSAPAFNWREGPNVFQKVRELGVNAALFGWHHPYCRVFGDSVAQCFAEPNGHPTDALLRETEAAEEGTAKTIAYLFRLEWENLRDVFRPTQGAQSENLKDAFVQHRHQQQYFHIRDRAYEAARNPQIGFEYIHFPAPHLFAIYDRKRQDFSLSPDTGYFDNLALADRTFGEMRKLLEQAGLWDDTSILITADHGLRPELWRGRSNWDSEMDRLTQGPASQTVPFILKLAGQHEGMVVNQAFSNVVSGDLSLAVLSGEISTPQQAAGWLAGRAAPQNISSR